MRSRIKENFSQEDMDFLRRLINSPLFTDTNEKADAILYRFKDKGFIELATILAYSARVVFDYDNEVQECCYRVLNSLEIE